MVKCALISGRGMGMMHGGNFHNHAEAEVVAVCDMDPELREKAEAEFQVQGYESIDELLANCDVDLINPNDINIERFKNNDLVF